MKAKMTLYSIVSLVGISTLSAQGLKIGNSYKKAAEFSMGNGNYLPLIVEACGMEKMDMPYFSYFIPRINVEGGLISRRYDSSYYEITAGYRMINVPLKTILINAYKNEFGDNQTNRIIVESKNPEKFNWPNDGNYKQWAQFNTWCYDIKVPISKAKKLDSIIREDFERTFDVKLSIEKRKVNCLALVKNSNFKPAKSIEKGYVRSVKD
jgi:hypothetical protein